MTSAVLATLLLLSPAEPPATIEGALGSGASFSDNSSATLPAMRFSFDAPFYIASKPRLRFGSWLQIGSFADAKDFSITKPETFASAEFHAELSKHVGGGGGFWTDFTTFGGWITRIVSQDTQDRRRFARYYGTGLRLSWYDGSEKRASVLIGWGRADMVRRDFGAGQLVAEGHFHFVDALGVEFAVWGSAFLDIGHSSRAVDLMRVWISMGKSKTMGR